MIQIFHGSIFDSKCDIIVIPCNVYGGVSASIAHELNLHNLPNPSINIEKSSVTFIENISRFTSASVIAYAASVPESGASTRDKIGDIANRIKAYCHEHSYRKINIPLLGTGAGGMNVVEVHEVFKKIFENDPRILLCIYTPYESAYNELTTLRKFLQKATSSAVKSPRVFISYTGTDLKHRNWVRDFACRLRANGVDARIDMFHLRPGQDLHQWMTNEVIMADKVLLICDKYYAEKADTRRSGVGWETMIILGDMLSSQEQTKYIGIIRDADIDQSLPIYVRSKYCLNWSDDEQVEKEFNDLILYLFDCDIEPPIGDIPDFVLSKLHN